MAGPVQKEHPGASHAWTDEESDSVRAAIDCLLSSLFPCSSPFPGKDNIPVTTSKWSQAPSAVYSRWLSCEDPNEFGQDEASVTSTSHCQLSSILTRMWPQSSNDPPVRKSSYRSEIRLEAGRGQDLTKVKEGPPFSSLLLSNTSVCIGAISMTATQLIAQHSLHISFPVSLEFPSK